MDDRNILIDYINSVTALAESLQDDIIKGSKVTSRTVLKLSHFIAAAEAFRHILKQLDVVTADHKNKLN